MKKYYESDEGYPPEEKYLYLLLYAPGYTNKLNESIKGDTWLQKIMHVLSKAIPVLNFEFDEHNFGAYSPALEAIQVQNATSHLIDQPSGDGPIKLTDKGIKVAKKLWNELSKKEQRVISEIKEFLNEMSYWELIAFAYSTFPETTSRSEIKPEFYRTRLNSAINLFKKQKVTLKKAASIAEIPSSEFIEELNKRNISAYELNRNHYEKSLKLIESFT